MHSRTHGGQRWRQAWIRLHRFHSSGWISNAIVHGALPTGRWWSARPGPLPPNPTRRRFTPAPLADLQARAFDICIRESWTSSTCPPDLCILSVNLRFRRSGHTPPKINQPSNQAPLIRQISPTTTTLSRYTYVSRSLLSPACVTYCLPTCRDVTVTPAINGTLCSSNSNLFDV